MKENIDKSSDNSISIVLNKAEIIKFLKGQIQTNSKPITKA